MRVALAALGARKAAPRASLEVTVGGRNARLIGRRVTRPPKNPPLRGPVGPLQGRTRLRLLRKINGVVKCAVPTFVSLSFADETLPGDAACAKARLRAWVRRLERTFGEGSVGLIWRMAWETRKSGAFIGRAVPHFHVLLWVPIERIPREYVARTWAGVQHHSTPEAHAKHLRSGYSVEYLRSLRAGGCYMAKLYVARGSLEPGPVNCGRRWGVLGPEAIPWAELRTLDIPWRAFHDVRRTLARAGHRSLRGAYPWEGLGVFVESPESLLRLASGP